MKIWYDMRIGKADSKDGICEEFELGLKNLPRNFQKYKA